MKMMTASKGFLLTVVVASALSGLARSYDVAAYVRPAYHPEPRWRELGIFADGKGEWQSLYEPDTLFGYGCLDALRKVLVEEVK